MSAVVFIAGFAAPAWRNDRGLWMICESKCISLSEAGIGYIGEFAEIVIAASWSYLCVTYLFSSLHHFIFTFAILAVMARFQ